MRILSQATSFTAGVLAGLLDRFLPKKTAPKNAGGHPYRVSDALPPDAPFTSTKAPHSTDTTPPADAANFTKPAGTRAARIRKKLFDPRLAEKVLLSGGGIDRKQTLATHMRGMNPVQRGLPEEPIGHPRGLSLELREVCFGHRVAIDRDPVLRRRADRDPELLEDPPDRRTPVHDRSVTGRVATPLGLRAFEVVLAEQQALVARSARSRLQLLGPASRLCGESG